MLKRRLALACLLSLAAMGNLLADGGGSSSSVQNTSSDPDYEAAVKAIQNEDYAQAIPKLEAYAARAPDDADAWNWLGYANRKSGHMDTAFSDYDKALRLDPKHRGAHEYVGEAYLTIGNLAKAEEHLNILDKLCLLPCEEFSDLKKAVAEYKVKNGAH